MVSKQRDREPVEGQDRECHIGKERRCQNENEGEQWAENGERGASRTRETEEGHPLLTPYETEEELELEGRVKHLESRIAYRAGKMDKLENLR